MNTRPSSVTTSVLIPSLITVLLLNLPAFADLISGTVVDSASGSALAAVRVTCGLTHETYTASNGTFSLSTTSAVLNHPAIRYGNKAKVSYTVSNLQGRVVVQRSLDRPDFTRIPPGIYIVSASAKGEPQLSYRVCNVSGLGEANSPDVGSVIATPAIAAGVAADTVTFTLAGYYPAQRIIAGSQSGLVVKLQRAPIIPGMRAIPGGTFQMGSSNAALEKFSSNSETPVHTVTVSSFYMDTTDVTQASYQSLMGVNPSYFDTGALAPRKPVEGLTWFDAVLYCNARSKADGRDTVYSFTGVWGTPGDGCDSLVNLTVDFAKNGYRLPTEAEWEYASRAGSSADFYWGQSYPPQTSADSVQISAHAWWSYNSGTGTQPVATKPPNAFGLYDMAGNVWQFCNDWYAGYQSGSLTDPTGPGPENCRVLRGGSWGYLGSVYLCAAFRYDKISTLRGFNFGFRCVRR